VVDRSGSARTIRNNVLRLFGKANRLQRRLPGRPPSATPISSSNDRSRRARSAPPIWMPARRTSRAGTRGGSSETGGPADRRLPAEQRLVSPLDFALVTVVERFRPGVAIWTACAGNFARNGDVHDLVTRLYLLDSEPCARRQWQLWIHRTPGRWPSNPPGWSVLPVGPGRCNLHPQAS
jgi:hypothetical protein